MKCPNCKKEIEDKLIISESARIRGKITSPKKTKANKANAISGWKKRKSKNEKIKDSL